MDRAYLDHNASAPLLIEAREAMLRVLENPGNASSVHHEGRAHRAVVEATRQEIARLTHGSSARVVFTSGASEAAATLLSPAYRMGRSTLQIRKLFVAATDHPCLLEGGRFEPGQVGRIPVDGRGIVDLEALDRLLGEVPGGEGPPLVACHHANNETGAVQPVAEIARIVKGRGGLFVVDSAQAAGRLPIDLEEIGADFIILSSHKMGGPQGAGAIVSASDLLMPAPLIRGGGQEKGHRAGTENVAAIAGFGAAARIARTRLADVDGLASMRGRFETVLVRHVPDVEVIAADAIRLANTVLFSIPGLKAETAQIAFDLAGVAMSAGSACSSGRVGESHVLHAMGLGRIGSALRLSIGYETGERELAIFETALKEIVARRKSRNAAA